MALVACAEIYSGVTVPHLSAIGCDVLRGAPHIVVGRRLVPLSLCRKVRAILSRPPAQRLPPDVEVDGSGGGVNLVDEVVPVVDQVLLEVTKPAGKVCTII